MDGGSIVVYSVTAMSKVTLTHIRVRGFRSCKDATLEPTPDLTALIGHNGSGKTNFLQAIMFLRYASHRPHRPAQQDSSATRCQIEAHFRIDSKTIGYRTTLVFRTNERGRDEVLESDEKWDFTELNWKDGWVRSPFLALSTLRSLYGGYNLPSFIETASRSETRLKFISNIKSEKVPKKVVSAVERIRHYCGGINYYSASQFTNPSLSPTSFEIDDDGDLIGSIRDRNYHSEFLFALFFLEQQNDDRYASFISLVGKQGLQLIDKITWRSIKFSSQNYEVKSGGGLVKKKRERKLIVPTIHKGPLRLSFNQLSEGTFRTLALLFYVITDRSELLLLEEPEVCVHHGLLNSVLEVIKDFSKSKQIIFSTHSEVVVDKLQPEQIRLVQNSEDRGTTIKPISKTLSSRGYKALKDYLEHAGTLGEYWRSAGFRE
jgi:energy-coupling factor transporter ATP-binding protein EcfA2